MAHTDTRTETVAREGAELDAWAGGVAGVRRPWSEAEAAALRRSRSLARFAAPLATSLFVAGAAAFAAVLVAIRDPSRWRAVGERLGELPILALPIVVGLSGWLASRLVEWKRRLETDAACPHVFEFWIGSGSFVLGSSGRWLGGSRRGRGAALRLVAPVPREAASYAIPAGESFHAAAGAERRRVTDAERREIAHLAGNATSSWRSPPLWLLTAWWLGAALAAVLAPEGNAARHLPLLAFLTLAAAVKWVGAVRAALAGGALREDGREGWVVRFGDGPDAGWERLARSGVPWSYQGDPAPWRIGRR